MNALTDSRRAADLLYDTFAVLNFVSDREADTPEVLEAIRLATEAADKVRVLIAERVALVDKEPEPEDAPRTPKIEVSYRLDKLAEISPTAADELLRNIPPAKLEDFDKP